MRNIHTGGFSFIGKGLDALDWQESVINLWNPATGLPIFPLYGDRYISTATANGWLNDYIYEWTGLSWYPIEPDEGSITWVEDLSSNYLYTGGVWGPITSDFSHNMLSGLQGGTTNQYYHLTSIQHAALSENIPFTANRFIASGTTGKLFATTIDILDPSYPKITIGETFYLTEQITPPNAPALGKVAVYAKQDGRIYGKDDQDVEFPLGITEGSVVTSIAVEGELTITGDVVLKAGQDIDLIQVDNEITIGLTTMEEWVSMYGIDENSPTYLYFGYAETHSDKWRIKRVDKTTGETTWAYGANNGTTAWSNRTSQSYGEI